MHDSTHANMTTDVNGRLPDERREPLVSIAMATYNGERFLRPQLDSLLSQTYLNFELVVFDDESTDATWTLLNEYASRDSRLRINRNTQRKGYIKNFETAISDCRGELIFLCDQDDIWENQKIRRHVDVYMAEPTVDWIANRVYLIDGEGVAVGHLEDAEADYYEAHTIVEALWGRCIIGCATSFRAHKLQQCLPIPSYAKAHDSWFQLKLRDGCRRLIDDRLQAYRIHGSNTAARKSPKTLSEKRAAWRSHRDLLLGVSSSSGFRTGTRMVAAAFYLRSLLASLYK